MAAITVDFTLSFNVSTGKFVVVDTTDYAGQGETASDYDGVIKVTDPSNTIIYNNTNFLSPDIDRATTDTNSDVDLPLDALSQKPLKGIYTVTYSVSDDTGSTTSQETKTFNFQYESPELVIEASFDCVTPLIKSEDKTSYLVAGQTPTSIVRNHTLFYPETTDGVDISADSKIIQTSEIYVRDNGEPLQYEITLESTLTYSYTGSGSNSDFGVTDVVSEDDYLDVTCDPNLCSIYCGLKSQYDLYIETKGTLQGDKAKAKLELMLAIAGLAKIAFECNKSADVSGLLDEIRSIGNFNDDCLCGDGDVILYQGLGLQASDVVVTDGVGIDVTSVTGGGITTYTVSVEQSLIDTINGFERAILVGGDQVDVVGVPGVGVQTWTINLDLNLTTGNIPMVDVTGDKLEDSPLSYNGTSLAASLAAGKDISLTVGASVATLNDTTATLVNGTETVGIFDDGGTQTSALIADTAYVKATATGIINLYGDHSTKWNDTDGILSEASNGGLDIVSHQLKAGFATQKAVLHFFEILTPSLPYVSEEFRVFSAAGQLFVLETSGIFELGLDAFSDDASNVVVGSSANADSTPGNIAIGKSALANGGGGNPNVAIGSEAEAKESGQISIGYKAGQDAGTQNINAISIGTFSNFSAVSNGVGSGSIAVGPTTQNFEGAERAVSIGNNIESNAAGAITMGYSSSPSALVPFGADSFNIGFNSLTPQVVFGVAQSYYNLSEIMFGSTAVAPSQVSVEGDVEVMSVGNGYILKSPDTTRWRVEVSNGGVLSASLA